MRTGSSLRHLAVIVNNSDLVVVQSPPDSERREELLCAGKHQVRYSLPFSTGGSGSPHEMPRSGLRPPDQLHVHAQLTVQTWQRFAAAKRRFDPNNVLTPGAGVFGGHL